MTSVVFVSFTLVELIFLGHIHYGKTVCFCKVFLIGYILVVPSCFSSVPDEYDPDYGLLFSELRLETCSG